FPVGGGPGQPQRGRRLFHRETGKNPRLDDPRGGGFLGGQAVQGVVQLQKPFVVAAGGQLKALDGDPWSELLSPRGVDQDAAHRLGRGGKEVAAVGELLIAHQAQVGLVDQGRRVQGLPRLFLGQLGRRQLAQLLVDQRQELRGGVRVAPL